VYVGAASPHYFLARVTQQQHPKTYQLQVGVVILEVQSGGAQAGGVATPKHGFAAIQSSAAQLQVAALGEGERALQGGHGRAGTGL